MRRELGTALYAYSPSTLGVDAGLGVQDQPELHEAQLPKQHNINPFVFLTSAKTSECPPAKELIWIAP